MLKNKMAIEKLPRLPIIMRELECVGARTDKQIRLHLEEKLSKLGAELSATNSTTIAAAADVSTVKSSQTCFQKELGEIRTLVSLYFQKFL